MPELAPWLIICHIPWLFDLIFSECLRCIAETGRKYLPPTLFLVILVVIFSRGGLPLSWQYYFTRRHTVITCQGTARERGCRFLTFTDVRLLMFPLNLILAPMHHYSCLIWLFGLSHQRTDQMPGTAGIMCVSMSVRWDSIKQISLNPNHHYLHIHTQQHAVKWNIKAFIISLQAGTGVDPETQKDKVKKDTSHQSDSNQGHFTQTEQHLTAGS